MKKFVKIFVVALFLVTLTACGTKKEETKSNVVKLKDQTVDKVTFKNIKITKDKVSKINFDITSEEKVELTNVKITLLTNDGEYLSHTIEIKSKIKRKYPVETLIDDDLKEVNGMKIEVE